MFIFLFFIMWPMDGLCAYKLEKGTLTNEYYRVKGDGVACVMTWPTLDLLLFF